MSMPRPNLRGLALPLMAMVLTAASVAYYALVWIPRQQEYVTERNFRLLLTQSAQIKAKIDNFDRTLDHALVSFGMPDPDETGEFARSVRTFAPDLEVLPHATSEGASQVRRLASNPPVAMVQRDEGTAYLYLGYCAFDVCNDNVPAIVARANLDQVVSRFLVADDAFDAILLASRDGRVILQRSPSGIQLARLDTLYRPPVDGDAGKGRPKTFVELAGSSNLADVTLGDADYKLYVQPIQLSLHPIVDDASTANAASGHLPRRSSDTAEWVLCGLMRADRLRATSATISYTYVLWFTLLLAVVVLVVPLAKLHLIGPRERWRAGDAVRVVVSVYAITALAACVIADVYFFGAVLPDQTNTELRTIATRINTQLTAEVERMDGQMQWAHANLPKNAPTGVIRRVAPGELAARIVGTRDRDVDAHTACAPIWACETGVLTRGPGAPPYPYFSLITWEDLDGWQRIKWGPGRGVTPFISLSTVDLPGYEEQRKARRNGADNTTRRLLGVMQSPNTGEILTVVWRPLELPPREDLADDYTALAGQAISTPVLIAVDRPVMPSDIEFAVVDERGRVMFHSSPSHVLRENFFEESDRDGALRAAVTSRSATGLMASYLGHRHRFYVKPLDLGSSWGDRGWSILVFQRTNVLETLNLEVLAIVAALFGAFAAIVALVCTLIYSVAPRRVIRWFWPDPLRRRSYRANTIANVITIVGFVVLLVTLDPVQLVLGVLLLTAIRVIVAFVPLAEEPTDSKAKVNGNGNGWHSAGWQSAFYSARVSLLVLVAAVPVIVSFRIAYDFETRLFALARHVERGEQLQARTRRIAADAGLLRLGKRDSQYSTERFIADRAALLWDQYELQMFREHPRMTRFDAFLRPMHRRFNDFAVTLDASLLHVPGREDDARPQDAAPSVQVDREATQAALVRPLPLQWFLKPLLLAAAIGGVLMALVALIRWVTRRMFLPDVMPRQVPMSLLRRSHVLVIGPPGSGKTQRLADVCGAVVFDVRALASAAPAAKQPFTSVAAAPGDWGPSSSIDSRAILSMWLAELDLSREDGVLGIDHLDDLLDDVEFCRQMLRVLRTLVHRCKRPVWLAAARDPLHVIRRLHGAEGLTRRELAEWELLLHTFHRYDVGLSAPEAYREQLAREAPPAALASIDIIAAECAPSRHLQRIGHNLAVRVAAGEIFSEPELLDAIASAAECHYWELWSGCSQDEQATLWHLAQEGVVNPRGRAVLGPLVRHGLIVQRGAFRIMNDTFRQFVVDVVTPEIAAAWERPADRVAWSNTRATMVTVAAGLVGLVYLTQQQLVSAWVGYLPALAPAIPVAVQILKTVQRGAQPSGANA